MSENNTGELTWQNVAELIAGARFTQKHMGLTVVGTVGDVAVVNGTVNQVQIKGTNAYRWAGERGDRHQCPGDADVPMDPKHSFRVEGDSIRVEGPKVGVLVFNLRR